ncbi:hypothetical protein ACIPX0_46170 [Streptomyces sp. NPDC090075]|uniref:hypothetical protein n=1 Tax=Streptomyces sp. NPDC090075 TaxID=3365937 RepID=UPI003806549A
MVREVSRRGIGALIHNEGINGFRYDSGSEFPTAWEPELVGQQTRPALGRVHGTYGEGPELSAQMSVAFVQAMPQGPGILAAGKNFLGYHSSKGTLNQAATRLGCRAQPEGCPGAGAGHPSCAGLSTQRRLVRIARWREGPAR